MNTTQEITINTTKNHDLEVTEIAQIGTAHLEDLPIFRFGCFSSSVASLIERFYMQFNGIQSDLNARKAWRGIVLLAILKKMVGLNSSAARAIQNRFTDIASLPKYRLNFAAEICEILDQFVWFITPIHLKPAIQLLKSVPFDRRIELIKRCRGLLLGVTNPEASAAIMKTVFELMQRQQRFDSNR